MPAISEACVCGFRKVSSRSMTSGTTLGPGVTSVFVALGITLDAPEPLSPTESWRSWQACLVPIGSAGLGGRKPGGGDHNRSGRKTGHTRKWRLLRLRLVNVISLGKMNYAGKPE